MGEGTYVVTGGNTGIGKAIAIALGKLNLHVVIVSRDPHRGEEALQEIRTESQNKSVELVVGDLGTIKSCFRLANVLLEKYQDIRTLINNAGVWQTKCVINADGLKTTFMVNHVAPFILSNLLLDRLRQNAPARIVNVNAGLYIKGKVNLETTPYGRDFSMFGTYANTKLCNVLFTCELARRIAGKGVTVNAVHPGVIRTKLGDTTGLLGLLLRFAKLFWGKPEEGAVAPVWLATSPELEGTNGKYFDLQKEMELTEAAQDQKLACQLWELSAKVSGLAV